jgi:PAS domain S-box-containing protein
MEGSGVFFVDASMKATHLIGRYNQSLVMLSILVSMFSAIMALQTAQIARRMESPLHRHVALGTGAIALGGGIWTMNFIGMLSFVLPMHIDYAISLTLLSFLSACITSWLALRMLTHAEVSRRALMINGTCVGLGITAMHYSGMASMHASAAIVRYAPGNVLLSIVVAVCLATFALWIRYGLRRTALGPTRRFLVSGTIIGLAIAGMHYISMASLRVIGEPGDPGTGMSFNNTMVALVLTAFTVTVTVLVTVFNGLMRSRNLYQRIEESQTRLNAILDTAVDGIITIDHHGLIQSFNHSAERLFGWQAAEVIGRNIKILMPEPDQSQHDNYLRNYLNSRVPKIIGSGREVIGLRKDGSLMPMRLAVGRVNLPDHLLFVGFVTDITDRHALEASLRQTAERAEQAAAAKSTFLATMSHEIRTPMNSIIGFTELLLQRNLGTVERNHMNTIRQSSISLLRLINDILDTTKMEKGNVVLESVDFSLKGLALQVESSLRLGAQSKHLLLNIHYPQDMPAYFLGDPLRILQVLSNLVSNAIKFTLRGKVDVVFAYANGLVSIQVHDTGIGMTPQQIESIFKPFTQADASISRRFGGTGLGTTIASQLVELMGGSIKVESTFGLGSVFHVNLPLSTGQKPPAPEFTTSHQALPSLNVLIADDVPQNLELLTLLLGNNGHRVTAACNGEEAVEKCTMAHYDVVLMDVHMPGTDGLHATQLIRQYERLNQRTPTPIIALTASVMGEDIRAARQAGMDGFATKPLDVPRLFDEIARVLNLHSLSAQTTDDTKICEVQHATHSDVVTSDQALIDWPTGTTLWGTPKRLAKALKQFLDTASKSYPLPSEETALMDWSAIRFSLHGLHGATGNLALPAISGLAARLEKMISTASPDEIRPLISELKDMLQRVALQLHQSGHLDTTALETGTKTVTTSGLLADMRDLLTYLAHNELHDKTLEKVHDGLLHKGERNAAQQLQTMIEAFEFTDAHALVQELIANFPLETSA